MMTSHAPIKVVYGGVSFVGKSPEEAQEILNILKKHHVEEIDTSPSHVRFLFGGYKTASVLTGKQDGNEALLKNHRVSEKQLIHTKAPSLAPKAMSKQSMLGAMEKSLKDLGLESVSGPVMECWTKAKKIYQFQVDLYYLHGPDPTTLIQETLEAVRELYSSGKFKRVFY